MQERNKDIFEWIAENSSNDNIIILMHCISADRALGAGIAKAIDEKYQIKKSLNETYIVNGEIWPTWEGHGFSLTLEDVSPNLYVCNLVTKNHYWSKPTYTSLCEALEHAKPVIENIASFARKNEKHLKIVMPRIGCGLDRLDWNRVKEMLIQYAGLDFDITVCYL